MSYFDFLKKLKQKINLQKEIIKRPSTKDLMYLEIIRATKSNDIKKIEFFINKGADINARNKYGVTALTTACSSYNFKTAEYLIRNGANVNVADRYGDTILIQASISNCYTSAKFLIKNGADVNQRNKDGETALILAVQQNNFGVAELLIENGADISVLDSYGKSVMTYINAYLKSKCSAQLMSFIEKIKHGPFGMEMSYA